jgi:MFS family permease
MEDKNEKVFGLKKNVFFLGLVSFFNDFSNEMIQSVMPVFLSVVLNVSPMSIGLIEGVADAVASFMRIFSGWFSDKIGKRKMPALFGYSLSVSTRPFFALASTFTQVFSLRIIDRMGKGFREAPRDALLVESANHEDLGKSFGYQRAIDALGGTLGPIAAFLILPMLSFTDNKYEILFFIAFAVGLLSIISFHFVKEIPRSDKNPLPKLNREFFAGNKNFTLFLMAVFIFGLGTLPIVLMLLRPIDLGLALTSVPLVYFLYKIVFVSTAVPLGKLADKIGERIIISGGLLVAIIAYFILAFSDSIVSVMVAFALFGIYSSATDGIERALAAKLINKELLGTGEGLLNAAVGISSLFAGFIGGGLWTIYGSEAAFLYGAFVSILGLFIFLLISFNGKVKSK